MNIILTNASGEYDISEMVDSVTITGSYNQCCRTCRFGLLASGADARIPFISCENGDMVRVFENGAEQYTGYVFGRQKATEDSFISVTCKDRGIYLNKNSASYSFSGATPENVAQRVCSDFGIEYGSIAATGIPVSRIFSNSTLYSIIMTCYTLAADKNGKKYALRFSGNRLNIFERTDTTDTITLDGSSNLQSAVFSDSIESMVNRVAIYNKNGVFVRYVSDDNAARLYGVMQSVLKQTDNDNKAAEADRIIMENGVKRTVTVENLGSVRLITGGTVVVNEPYTGLSGLFYIDGDTHTWKNGQYYNKLTLNFDKIMDEQTTGSEPK